MNIVVPLASNGRKAPVIICAVLLALALSGCARNGTKSAEKEPQEEAIYQEARRLLDARRYDLAIQQLEYLQSIFPFGPYAEQAQLEMMYSLYRSSRFEEAVEKAQQFILLHPGHPRIDYAYYLQGLAAFQRQRGLFDRFLPLDTSKRDLAGARKAMEYFGQLLQRDPDSPYAEDARKRMIEMRNLLARQEVTVANYYLQNQVWLSAAKRAQYVVRNFQGAPAMPDALAVLIYAYYKLGIDDLAEDARIALAQNYPEHPALDAQGNWVASAQRAEPSGWARVLAGMFPPRLSFDTRSLYERQWPETEAYSFERRAAQKQRLKP